jgi:3-oxoacyl-[acyl-carrier protein] reductase
MSVAVVTGASRGIGKACALALAKRGYDVAVNFVSNQAAADAVVNEITALGQKAIAVQADTSDLKAVKTMFRTVVAELGGVDVLVNNAGVVDDRYLLMLTEESLEKSLEINIKGYFHCAQQASLKMMKKRAGVIINMSSVSSIVAIPGQTVYSATKGAVNAMTATMAKELAQFGIRVNAVAPGFIQTEMMDHIPEDQKESHLKAIPLGRFGTAEDVANLVCSLCSPELSYLTGQTIMLDGGLSL